MRLPGKVLTVCALLTVPNFARAHGDYDWIRKEFGSCCGPVDCFPISLTPEARDGRPGYRTQDGDWIPHASTKPSRDPEGKHWRCYHMRPGPIGLVRGKPRENCTFVSPGLF